MDRDCNYGCDREDFGSSSDLCPHDDSVYPKPQRERWFFEEVVGALLMIGFILSPVAVIFFPKVVIHFFPAFQLIWVKVLYWICYFLGLCLCLCVYFDRERIHSTTGRTSI